VTERYAGAILIELCGFVQFACDGPARQSYEADVDGSGRPQHAHDAHRSL